MALEFYNAFRNAFDGEPANYWQELHQAAVDDTWFDTSTVRKVQGQTMPGMRTYACESVQVNSVLDPKTGTSLGDNYRKIIYRVLKDNEIKDDLTKTKRWLGKYYKLEDYTWLTINTNTNIGAFATAVLEKCNNSLKWYDKDKILHVWPCVFERTLGSTSFSWGSQEVPEVDSTTLIKVQLNEETAKIPFNQRFLFDGHAFQVKQLNLVGLQLLCYLMCVDNMFRFRLSLLCLIFVIEHHPRLSKNILQNIFVDVGSMLQCRKI